MKTFAKVMVLGVLMLGLSISVVNAAEGKGAVQTKTGTVKKVDAEAKQVVVMVARELTFTVTDDTKILQDEKPAKLADIKVDGKVSVDYVKEGEKRTAQKIVILKE
jgi:hypothetical protein